MTNDVFEEFQWRGLIQEYSAGLPEALAKGKLTAYIGFDPTSDSLQVGNLMTLMGLARLQHFGHTPIAVAGGGTGLIGDPSGKSAERQLQSREQIAANTESIKLQLARFLDFEAADNPAQLVDNAEWLTTIPLMDFLRDVGKHFTVNYMLAKDSVSSRLEREEGISYTEFSYMLLQSYDFLQLFERYHCTLQMGGSDQWGNITAGVELIRKSRGESAYALVWPLVTDANGVKLGKTVHGAVYLDPQKTSPYRFYQFWLNTSDADVIQHLKYFTWLDREQIEALARSLEARPQDREAQRTLAQELTRTVHGDEALAQAEGASQVLFGGAIEGLTVADIADIFADVPASELPMTEFAGDGKSLVDLLAETGLAKSKGDARRLIASGGVYVNNERAADDPAQTVGMSQVVDGRFVILRVGKKQYHLVRVLKAADTNG